MFILPQPAINMFTPDHEFAGGWVDCIPEGDDLPLRENGKKALERMMVQEAISKRDPLVLTREKGSVNLAFRIVKGRKKWYYINWLKDHFSICTMCGNEPDCPINVPVLLNGILYVPVWSWWLDQACYGWEKEKGGKSE
jgi:hypothetical protein